MYAIQRNGGSSFFGAAFMAGGMRNFSLRGELPYGSVIGARKLKEKGELDNPKLLRSLRTYIDFGFDIDFNRNIWLGFSLGIIKDYFVSRNIFLSPQAGLGISLALTEKDYKLPLAEVGMDLGISTGPKTRIFTTFRLFLPPWLQQPSVPVSIGIGFRQELTKN
jgi:hypothetical protein